MGGHFEVEVKETYVVKTPTPQFLSTWDLAEWVEIVNSLSDIPGIQPIYLEDGKIIQPIAPGGALPTIDNKWIFTRISRIWAEIRSRGYDLQNIHPGDVFYDSKTGIITIVDLGQLSKVTIDTPTDWPGER